MQYQRYLAVTTAALATASAACVAVAVWLQPVAGDLTRLGGYAESGFGWKGEQLRFSPPIAPLGVLDRPYDVVIVGDSFTMPGEITGPPHPEDPTHWTDFFSARTGLSAGSFSWSRVTLETYLGSDGFRQTPPRLLVVEYAERALQHAPNPEPNPQQGPCAAPAPPRFMAVPLLPAPVQAQAYTRDTSHALNTGRIDSAVDYITKNALRRIGINLIDVTIQPLSKSGLFTDVRDTELLVYGDDYVKAGMGEAYLRSLSCYFTDMQRRVEANGITKFVLMIPPDRTTVYAAYLPGVHLPNLTARLAQAEGLSLVRLDLALKEAAGQGVKDLYLPNDTHWGSAGMMVAADSLIRFLNSRP